MKKFKFPPGKKSHFKLTKPVFYPKIRSKLTLVIAGILLFNMFATYLFGQTLFKKFYTVSKSRELSSIQSEIKTNYLADSTEELTQKINEAEKKNITILIFSIKDEAATVLYFSRSADLQQPNNNTQTPGGDHGKYNPLIWINIAMDNNVITTLNNQTDSKPIIKTQAKFSMQPDARFENKSMQIYSLLETGTYLFMETPQEYLDETANLAVRYTLYITLCTFFLALFLLIPVTKKITKPISNIESVANKIANMDFLEKCRVESRDELGQLGNSINRMADTLQENIHRLTVMNAMLREDLEKEEQTNKIRREFIANVSHDFKTPLSLITAYSESIRDSAESATTQSEKTELMKQCDIIISESNRMDGLVNQLLRLSQLENKMVVLQESMFDLTGFVEEVIYQHQILIKAKKITVDFADRIERIAYGDYTKTGQVLNNLLENAIKYTHENGTIKIWITKGEKFKIHLYNEVDHIEDVDPDQLFTSFYKRDQSRSLEDKSYGLGLAIVKAIVELHHNQCGAYKQGTGLVFWFEIQAYDETKLQG